ncbi:uncharacterized protein TM35_000132550 [Trypanosoma theileri]|uniref:Uncharacterized protein n=1 Tax=Trypanosoma theileri TaxID=67003 RepID=A0A1X0NXB9_9TRYP|nr:uncharacterized protein TM35_000132550 [Trypanosoma theileri]ORC89251.1 hypothetical protein TM35_000132550 [Trypanosoma theileri]
MEECPDAGSSPSSATAVFIREENSTTAGFVPIRFNGNITVRELAEEYCITSLIECDATGSVQPRAVALDSPFDILHGGKYYIARRDVKEVGLSPRVTFRGKIIVEEFDADHAVAARENDENTLHSTVPAAAETSTTTSMMMMSGNSVKKMGMTRKRRERDDDDDDWNDGMGEGVGEKGKDEDKSDENINGNTHMFVPFVGDLYDDGNERLIQLKDVKRLCENVESDEAEFRARHDRAETILKEVKELLVALANASNVSVEDEPGL